GGCTGQGDGNSTVLTDSEGLGVLWNDNRRLKSVAVGSHDLAVGVQVKSTVAAVGNSAVRLGHLKETTTVDRQVQRVVGGLQATGWG
ncbi:hypothetical protein PSYMO_09659, partial [Pseudomonas amygdali pv. mori str. 301020]